MRITYIWHDCFLLEADKCNMVFDFWKEDGVEKETIPTFLHPLDRGKPLYVFVSHHHKDHFTRRIFEWEKEFPEIRFIISRDTEKMVRHMLRPESIYTGFRPSPERVHVLRPSETYTDDILQVNAFGSTDIGNSYLITIGSYTIFHAGDLNAWVWMEESTQEEIDDMLKRFRAILATVKVEAPTIDYAMFPVDARMGREYWTGAAIFVRELKVARFFPMHFALGESPRQQREFERKAANFRAYANPDRGDYIALLTPYASYQNPSVQEPI